MSYDVNFDGPNGSPWPGYAGIVTFGGTGGVADIQNNEGRLRFNDTGDYSNRVKMARSMDPVTDANTLVTFRAPSTLPDIVVESTISGSGKQPSWMGTPANNYTISVAVAVGKATMTRQENEQPALNIGLDTAFTVAANDLVHMRISRTGGVIRGKLWKNAEAEPSLWKWEYTDPSPLPAGIDSLSMRGSPGHNGKDVFYTRHTSVTGSGTATGSTFELVTTGEVSGATSIRVPMISPTPGALLVSVLGVDKSAGGANSMRLTTPDWVTLGRYDDGGHVSGAIALKQATGSETELTWTKNSTTTMNVSVLQATNLKFSLRDAVAYVSAIDTAVDTSASVTTPAAPADGIAIAYHSVDTTNSGAWAAGFPSFSNGYVLQSKHLGSASGAAGVSLASKSVKAGDAMSTTVTINQADQNYVGVVFIPYARLRPKRAWKKPGSTTSLLDDVDVSIRPPVASLPVVTNVTATAQAGRIVLSWDIVTSAATPTSFRVGRDGTDAQGTVGWTATVGGSVRSYAFENLVNNSTYNVYVEPMNETRAGNRITRAATPRLVSTGGDAPVQPTVAGTLPTHMKGTWTPIFVDDFDDPTITAQKWNLNRESYHTTNGWWTQDQAGMQVPPQSDALEFLDSAVWLKVTRKTNPTGKPFVNAIMTTGRPNQAQETPCKFSLKKNSTTFTEGLLWNGTARGTLSGFWLLGNTAAGDALDVFGNPTQGKGPNGEIVWGQTTAGWPTGGEVDILEFAENNTGERHRPFTSLHWAKDDNPTANPPYPGTWGSREFLAHPDSAARQRPELQNSWHTWGLYRSPTLMVIYIDGVELCRWVNGNTYTAWDGPHTPAPIEFTGEMYLFLSYSIGGGWGGQGWAADQLDEGKFGAKYVKVWELSSGGTAPVPTAAPGIPTGGRVEVTGTTVNVVWAPPASDGGSPITGYYVGRDGTDANGVGAEEFLLSRTTNLNYAFSYLKQQTRYNFSVRAVNAVGMSTQPLVMSATTGNVDGTGGDTPPSGPRATVKPNAPAAVRDMAWKTIFLDDFEGTTLDRTKWVEHGHWQGPPGYSYDAFYPVPTNSSVLEVGTFQGASALKLKARRDPTVPTALKWKTAQIFTWPHAKWAGPGFVSPQPVTSEFFEARLFCQGGFGTSEQWWGLHPTAQWPGGGEWDFMEMFNLDEGWLGIPHFSLHWLTTANTHTHIGKAYRPLNGPNPDMLNRWITIGAWRTPRFIRGYVNGIQFCEFLPGVSYNGSEPLPTYLFTNPISLILGLGVGGYQGSGKPESQWQESDFLVDYAQVWVDTGTSTGSTVSAPQASGSPVVGNGTVKVSWLPPATTGGSTITGYYVARDGIDAKGTGPWSTTVADPNLRSYTFYNMVAGNTYNFTVAAATTSGNGASLTQTVTMPSADLWLKPFSTDSLWNRLKKTNATVESSTGTLTAAVLSGGNAWANYGEWSHPIVTSTTSDPVAEIVDTSDSSRSTTAYVPTSAIIAGESSTEYRDRHMHVVQPDGVTILECFGTRRISSTRYEVGRVHKVDMRASGIGPQNGVRAYGGSAVAGLIRGWEVDPMHPRYTGEIEHVIAMAIPAADLYYSGSLHLASGEYNNYYTDDITQTFPGWNARSRRGFMKSQGYRWPATEHDWNARDSYTGPVPMGTMFCIPTSVDINAITREDGTPLTNEGKMLARAYQRYGGRVTDRSDAVTLAYFDQSPACATFAGVLVGPSWTARDLKAIRANLRAVTGESESTPAYA